jgi:5-methylcytosine-specific restriction endonuclease McrA
VALSPSERQRRYRARHPERVTARVGAWRAANPDKTRRQKKAWNKANPDRVAAYERTKYRRHATKIKARVSAWQAANPDKVKIQSAIRAARKRAGGGFTRQDVEAKFDLQGGACVYCPAPLSLGFEIDHRMPLALHGPNTPENIQLLCVTCNRRKGKKHPDVWLAELTGNV